MEGIGWKAKQFIFSGSSVYFRSVLLREFLPNLTVSIGNLTVSIMLVLYYGALRIFCQAFET